MKRLQKQVITFLIISLLVSMLPLVAEAAAKINKTSVTLEIGKKVTLKVNGSKKKVTWKSSDKKIATVTSKGVVQAVSKGNCIITAQIKSKEYTCKVTVMQSRQNLKISKESATLKIGETITLGVTNKTEDNNESVYIWKSSNPKVAEVSNKGRVKAMTVGQAVITVSDKEDAKQKAQCLITVKKSEKEETNKHKLITKTIKITLDNVGDFYEGGPRYFVNKSDGILRTGMFISSKYIKDGWLPYSCSSDFQIDAIWRRTYIPDASSEVKNVTYLGEGGPEMGSMGNEVADSFSFEFLGFTRATGTITLVSKDCVVGHIESPYTDPRAKAGGLMIRIVTLCDGSKIRIHDLPYIDGYDYECILGKY